MAGYSERINKAAELAGFKVKRSAEPERAQTAEEVMGAMQAWVQATARR